MVIKAQFSVKRGLSIGKVAWFLLGGVQRKNQIPRRFSNKLLINPQRISSSLPVYLLWGSALPISQTKPFNRSGLLQAVGQLVPFWGSQQAVGQLPPFWVRPWVSRCHFAAGRESVRPLQCGAGMEQWLSHPAELTLLAHTVPTWLFWASQLFLQCLKPMKEWAAYEFYCPTWCVVFVSTW